MYVWVGETRRRERAVMLMVSGNESEWELKTRTDVNDHQGKEIVRLADDIDRFNQYGISFELQPCRTGKIERGDNLETSRHWDWSFVYFQYLWLINLLFVLTLAALVILSGVYAHEVNIVAVFIRVGLFDRHSRRTSVSFLSLFLARSYLSVCRLSSPYTYNQSHSIT